MTRRLHGVLHSEAFDSLKLHCSGDDVEDTWDTEKCRGTSVNSLESSKSCPQVFVLGDDILHW
jgi:hypothetical protein